MICFAHMKHTVAILILSKVSSVLRAQLFCVVLKELYQCGVLLSGVATAS